MKKNQKKNDVFFEKEGKKEEKGAFQGHFSRSKGKEKRPRPL